MIPGLSWFNVVEARVKDMFSSTDPLWIFGVSYGQQENDSIAGRNTYAVLCKKYTVGIIVYL